MKSYQNTSKNQKSGKMNRKNITSIGEVYKLRKVLERIEKKLDNYIKSTNQFYDDTKGI